jgi:hypothetical protein
MAEGGETVVEVPTVVREIFSASDFEKNVAIDASRLNDYLFKVSGSHFIRTAALINTRSFSLRHWRLRTAKAPFSVTGDGLRCEAHQVIARRGATGNKSLFHHSTATRVIVCTCLARGPVLQMELRMMTVERDVTGMIQEKTDKVREDKDQLAKVSAVTPLLPAADDWVLHTSRTAMSAR